MLYVSLTFSYKSLYFFSFINSYKKVKWMTYIFMHKCFVFEVLAYIVCMCCIIFSSLLEVPSLKLISSQIIGNKGEVLKNINSFMSWSTYYCQTQMYMYIGHKNRDIQSVLTNCKLVELLGLLLHGNSLAIFYSLCFFFFFFEVADLLSVSNMMSFHRSLLLYVRSLVNIDMLIISEIRIVIIYLVMFDADGGKGKGNCGDEAT